jgi:hypothetical protein
MTVDSVSDVFFARMVRLPIPRTLTFVVVMKNAALRPRVRAGSWIIALKMQTCPRKEFGSIYFHALLRKEVQALLALDAVHLVELDAQVDALAVDLDVLRWARIARHSHFTMHQMTRPTMSTEKSAAKKSVNVASPNILPLPRDWSRRSFLVLVSGFRTDPGEAHPASASRQRISVPAVLTR